MRQNCSSTSRNSCSENVGIETVVVPELKFRDVEREVFLTDFVIAAHDATLNQGPKTLNRVGVDRADNMLAFTVIDDAVIEIPLKSFVGGEGVGAEQTNASRDRFLDEGLQGHAAGRIDDAGDDVAFAADRTDDRDFAERP